MSKMHILPVMPHVIRVVCTPDGLVKAPDCQVLYPELPTACEIASAVDRETGRITFSWAGKELLTQAGWKLTPHDVTRFTARNGAPKIVRRKTVDGERSFVENAEVAVIGHSYGGSVSFHVQPDEYLFGLGQHERGYYNRRGMKEALYQNNMKIPMPVLVSSRGYALFFDCGGMMTYEEKDGTVTFTFDTADQIDYYLIAGHTTDELIASLRCLTGEAVMLPAWAYRYLQSKERYKDEQEMLAVKDEFRRREIPLGALILDWKTWEEGKWGNKILDKTRFGHFKETLDTFHKDGVAAMISVWPNSDQGCENNQEFADAGKLLCDCSTYDAFDSEARDLYWKQCMQEIVPAGIDGWWCDSTEPFTPDWNGSEKLPEDVRYEKARGQMNRFLDAREANLFALHHAKGIYEHMRQDVPDKRVINLTRSGSPSIQRYGVVLWSGDIAATWETLRRQIAEGINMALSGIPYWTLDIGAFFVGNLKASRIWSGNPNAAPLWFWHGDYEEGVNDPGYRELYTRWLQFGTFLPVMRSHGTDTPREPWNFGEPGTVYYDTIVKYIRLRERLFPYIYSLADRVRRDGYTTMRGLVFDFAQDPKALACEDEYMFGPAFLVCPVTKPMEYGPNGTPLAEKQTRAVYLPAGSDWIDYETGACYNGGQTIEADAPISHMPLYVRAGSIIPQAAETQACAESINGPQTAAGSATTEIHIYPGADAQFTLYLDNGKDYFYEKGEFCRIPLSWDDQNRTLSIGKISGSYPTPQELTVVLHTASGMLKETLAVRQQRVVFRNLA